MDKDRENEAATDRYRETEAARATEGAAREVEAHGLKPTEGDEGALARQAIEGDEPNEAARDRY